MQCDKTWFKVCDNILWKDLCIPCFNCLCSVLTMSLVHTKNLISQFLKSKMADRSEMARNAIQSEFRTSKMTESSHFVKNFQKNKKAAILSKIFKKNKVAYRSEMARNASDFNNVRTDCWLTTTWYQYIYTYRQLCWERGNTLCSPFRANAHNSSFQRKRVSFLPKITIQHVQWMLCLISVHSCNPIQIRMHQ